LGADVRPNSGRVAPEINILNNLNTETSTTTSMKKSNGQAQRGSKPRKAAAAPQPGRQRFGRNGGKRENTQLGWSIVEKDELIQAVNGSSSLASVQFALNPGMAATFPLGSPEAKRFTEWKAVYCEPYFRRTVSEYATQGQIGRVVLAFDYSALNDAPASLQAAEALHCAMGMPCTPEIRLKLDPSILNKADPKYIRSGPISGHSDIRLFDGGNLWFVTDGCTNSSQIGELRIRYKFLVRLPNLDDTGSDVPTTYAQFGLSANMDLVSGTAKIVAFDDEVMNGPGITNTSGVFTLPVGAWLVQAELGVYGGTSNSQVAVVQLYADGNPLASPAKSRVSSDTAEGSAIAFAVVASSVVVSDGTTTVQAMATYTSAAGTLVASGTYNRIRFLAL
jgi:hypothetical protein